MIVDEAGGKQEKRGRKFMSVTAATENSSTNKPLEITSNSSIDQVQTVQDTENSSGSSFDDFMKSALGATGKNQVSEEELFASLIEQRLNELSPEAASFYAGERTKLQASMTKPNGYVPVEEAALKALNSTVASGQITEEDGARINGEAFAGAQLDDDLENLFDDRGGDGDTTIAVASIDEAMAKLKLFMDGMKSGTLTSTDRPLSAGATGGQLTNSGGSSETGGIPGSGSSISGSQAIDGSGGFVWKPVSESDGNLVVLLPTELKGLISKVEIHSSLPPSEASKLAEGKFSGDDDNGERPHYRFPNPGSEYGDNVHVVGYKDDGTTVTWEIGNGGQRYD